MSDDQPTTDHTPAAAPGLSASGHSMADLPPAAQRALAEAEERRRKAAAEPAPKEYGGRDGPDPARYGDWEKKGLAIDF